MGIERNFSKGKNKLETEPLQKEEKEISLKGIRKRVGIPLVALLAYVLTYTYFVAQYMYYKIPLNFLSFDNHKVLGFSAIVFVVLLGLLMLVKGIRKSGKDTAKTSRLKKGSIMAYAAITIILTVLFYLNIINFYAWLGIAIISLILLPFFPKNKTAFYSFSILALVSFLLLSAYIGRFTAEHKAAYYVIKAQKQSYVVLDTYKDNLIIAQVNLKKKVIDTEYQVVDSKSDLFNKSKQIVLDFAYTGPLKVKN